MAKVLVIGLGLSGRAAAQHLLSLNEKVFCYDDAASRLVSDNDLQPLIEAGVIPLDTLPDLEFDCAILSPGVAPDHPVVAALRTAGIPLIGETEWACRRLPYPCIGITGTNGKTTVTMLVSHVLKSLGWPAYPAGNNGIPLSRLLKDPLPSSTILALELSSFQLETLESRFLDVAVILNLTEDHLDRYSSMEAYAAAKWRIACCLKEGGTCYVDDAFLKRYPCPYDTVAVPFSALDVQKSWPPDLAPYQCEQLLAAYAVLQGWGVTICQLMQAFETFERAPHRIQHIANIKDVDYYDDSKGTTVAAVIAAVQALAPRPIHLIAGGKAKGATFVPWRSPFPQAVKAIYAIGSATAQLIQELGDVLEVRPCASLAAAVEYAAKSAAAGEVVLLSPGCASTDMFRDYVQRGELFQRYVAALKPNLPPTS